jgi:hypothetical protein
MHYVRMLTRTSIFLNKVDMKALGSLAKRRQLKKSQLVRFAIQEYLQREISKEQELAKAS